MPPRAERRRRVRPVLVAPWALLGFFLLAEAASACSCVERPARDRYREADAAFIGVVESRRVVGRDPYGHDLLVYTYAVEEDFKRELGDRVEVETTSNGGTCGYDARPGDRDGVLLDERSRTAEGRYAAGICDLIDPEELRRAAREEGDPAPPEERDPAGREEGGPAPPIGQPRDRGPADQRAGGGLLVSGRFGSSRLLLLDPLGRILARGRGAGVVLAADVCPLGRRVAELVREPSGSRTVIRALPTLRAVGSRRTAVPLGFRQGTTIRCVDRRGRRTAVTPRRDGRPAGVRLNGAIYRLSGRSLIRQGPDGSRRRLHTFGSRPHDLISIPLLQPFAAAAAVPAPCASAG